MFIAMNNKIDRAPLGAPRTCRSYGARQGFFVGTYKHVAPLEQRQKAQP